MPPHHPPLRFRKATLRFDRTLIAAIVNVTPDSFSDGGLHVDMASAVSFGLRCVDEGADLLDVGGESTRPGAELITAEEELRRVLPVIRALAGQVSVPLSIDTTKAEVARAALEAGAELVNDISGGRFDPALPGVVADAGAVFIAGHVRGSTLAQVHDPAAPEPTFEEIVAELAASLRATSVRTIADPGLGFGKRAATNLELLRRAGELSERLGRPVMVGPSRKRFLGELTGRPPSERDDATVGACLAAAASGAQLVRVHAVRPVRDALTVFESVRRT
jgi:dihydropteroate synthase